MRIIHFVTAHFSIRFYMDRMLQYDSFSLHYKPKTKNVFNTPILRCELAFQLNIQMVYGKPGCIKKHPRPAVAHDFLYLPPFFRCIAMGLAGTAKCLVCHMRAVLCALAYIVSQALASGTETVLCMMFAAAVYAYHERNRIQLMVPLFF